MNAPDPVDTSAPWTIKSVPTQTREAVTKAARQEGLTVGQWLEKRVREWLTDGRPVHVDGESSPVSDAGNPERVRAFADLLGAMTAAGIAPEKRVNRAANRVAMQAAAVALGAGKPRQAALLALPAPPSDV